MKYKKGDRILYNRQKFGTVRSDQYNQIEVDVVFDRDKRKIVAVRADMLELVSDPQHEARLSTLINSPVKITDGQHTITTEGPYSVAGEILKIAEELSFGADLEKNTLRLRTIMKNASLRLRGIAEDM